MPLTSLVAPVAGSTKDVPAREVDDRADVDPGIVETYNWASTGVSKAAAHVGKVLVASAELTRWPPPPASTSARGTRSIRGFN